MRREMHKENQGSGYNNISLRPVTWKNLIRECNDDLINLQNKLVLDLIRFYRIVFHLLLHQLITVNY